MIGSGLLLLFTAIALGFVCWFDKNVAAGVLGVICLAAAIDLLWFCWTHHRLKRAAALAQATKETAP